MGGALPPHYDLNGVPIDEGQRRRSKFIQEKIWWGSIKKFINMK